MADFSGHSERFHVVVADDSTREEALLELSMEGLKVMNPAGSLTRRKYPLEHITRWSRATDRLTMFVKTPVDVEEKALTLYGPHPVLSSLLDSLTSFCLQCAPLARRFRPRHALLPSRRAAALRSDTAGRASLERPPSQQHAHGSARAGRSGWHVHACTRPTPALPRLVEIMEAREGADAREAAREMRAVAKNGGRRHRQVMGFKERGG